MTYSLDLRQRVISYIKDGGSKAKAARIYGVHRDTVYNWLSRKNLMPTPCLTRNRKIDKQALRKHVEDYPDLFLRERAAHFCVAISSMGHALNKMKIGKKKNGAT